MNENEISRIAAATNALRPDWPPASIRTLITDKLADRTRRDVAVAFAWVACESATKTPARVLEAGPWWHAASAETGTTTHTGRTLGLRDGDPRTICGICDMWRVDCERRLETGGHRFVPRSECLPPTTVEGPHFKRGTCLAGPPASPCLLITGHDGEHDCPTSPAAAPVAHLRALRDEATAELCGHGVPLVNCLDHRKRQDDEPTHHPTTSPQGAPHAEA